MTSFLSIDQLKRALAIEEKIQALREELASIFAETKTPTPSSEATPQATSSTDRRTGKRSAATRAKMAAAQRARWAKTKGPSLDSSPRAKRKWTMSAEARAKISAAQKRRWAAANSGAKA
jgi:uncharacterized membrane protein